MHTRTHLVVLASASALLLFLGGRLTAYITPGQFLGEESIQSGESSSQSSVPIPVLPLPASSAPSSVLIPVLPLPASSAQSSVLIPVLPLPSSSGISSVHASSKSSLRPISSYKGGGGGGGGGGGKYSSSASKKTGSSAGNDKYTLYVPPVKSTTKIADTAVTPAYEEYYRRLAGSALQPAAPVIETNSSSTPRSSVSPISSPSTVISSRAIKVKGNTTASLPASGFPYAAASLLAVTAGFLVLRSVRRMELPSDRR